MSIWSNFCLMLKNASYSYAKARMCSRFGMTLPELDLYMDSINTCSSYYSKNLGVLLKQRSMNNKLRKQYINMNSSCGLKV